MDSGGITDPITSLLLALGRAGWWTIVSCREDAADRTVRISFGSVADVRGFLDLVAPADGERDDLAERAKIDMDSRVEVVFPFDDLQAVLERIQQADAALSSSRTSEGG